MTSRKMRTQVAGSYRITHASAKHSGKIVALILSGICIAGFLIRTLPARERVFRNGGTVFHETDCWYHVRLIENLVANFPCLITFDPYMLYPGGQTIPVAPLFDYVVATACMIVGLGQPSTATVETVCAYMPPLLGVAVIVVGYHISRRFTGRFGALLAAALIAILPAHFFRTTRLGFVDHHVMEVLFSSATFLFLLRGLSGSEEERKKRSLRAGILAGISLGAYMLAWIGAGLFVGILLVWFFFQLMHDHLRGRNTSNLIRLSLPLFVVPLVMVAPAAWAGFAVREHIFYLLIALTTVCVSAICLRLADRFKAPKYVFPVVCVIGVIIAAIVYPRTLQTITRVFGIFSLSDAAASVRELAPLLKGADGWTLAIAYKQLTTGFFIAMVALPLLFWQALRQGDAAKILLALWSLCILGVTLSMSRFTYYYTVNVALLCGFLVDWLMIRLASFTMRWPTAPRQLANVAAVTIMLLVCIAPNIQPVSSFASSHSGPNDDWIAALRWMRQEMPEPMGDAASFTAWYSRPSPGQSFQYPPSAYGVMSWWDYGYWIIGMGHRIPNANPTQSGAVEAAKFFLAQDEETGTSILGSRGARYVIVDARMILSWNQRAKEFGGKFFGIAAWAGQPATKFVETVVQRDNDGRTHKVALYYPAFYRCLLNRLYIFRGKAVVPEQVFVARLKDQSNDTDTKELVELREFENYEAALAHVNTRPAEKLEIVGMSPFGSCVPLEKLAHFATRYQSPTHVAETVSYVEVYEYVPEDSPTSRPSASSN